MTLYSQIYCFNYYTKRNIEKMSASIEKYNEYFKGKDWNEFNEEQIKFENDIVYICNY